MVNTSIVSFGSICNMSLDLDINNLYVPMEKTYLNNTTTSKLNIFQDKVRTERAPTRLQQHI